MFLSFVISNQKHIHTLPFKGERGHEVLAKILRGEPDVGKMFEEEYRNTRANLPVQADKKTNVSQKQDKQMGSETAKYEIDQFVTNTCNTDVTMNKYVMERLNTVNETKGVSTTTTTTNIQTIEYKKLQLKSDIIEEVRNGRYQIKIAPSDLIDFGGQKSYDMTHQLFIQHGGSFLLMFDGRFGLHEQLQGYPVGNTAACKYNKAMHIYLINLIQIILHFFRYTIKRFKITFQF